ncbi:class A beta-lactamase [Puia sp.]|jgi:beta-lactamase class A|uniref:class A beta-lactamase n=1 Tax=Puia sp. TaxID=2045100 RepID=UPI002F41A653
MNKQIKHSILISAALASTLIGRAQDRQLTDSLTIIAREAKGRVGVALELTDPVSSGINTFNGLNAQMHFPMQSVYKFPLAMFVLHKVDLGQLSLDKKIHIGKKDWPAKLYSPLRDRYKGQDVDLPLKEILRFTVSQSDNAGCDVLFRLVGGPEKVQAYITGLGVKDISIQTTEDEQARAWEVQYRNWSTPAAMIQLLRILYRGGTLSAGSREVLLQMMEATTTGPMRIVHLLPPGTRVAHKTGTSNTNAAGITAATNDVGIITLPNARKEHLLIVVFVADAAANEETREQVIARIARLAYRTYSLGHGAVIAAKGRKGGEEKERIK